MLLYFWSWKVLGMAFLDRTFFKKDTFFLFLISVQLLVCWYLSLTCILYIISRFITSRFAPGKYPFIVIRSLGSFFTFHNS